jgi:hypothetical protein
MEYRKFLKMCEQEIIKADATPSLEDDFMREIINPDGEINYYVTDNFFEMISDLEETWPKIEYLLYKYAILSRGFVKDEDITEKTKEEELIKRILNS